MIKYCNNLDLEKKNIDSRYYLFYQVWKEFMERIYRSKNIRFISI